MPDGGDALVHLDLHPLNVIMQPERGPVVIDWANASRGDGLFDIGVTYVLLTCPVMPGLRRAPRGGETDPRAARTRVTKRYRGRAARRRIAEAAELKTLDTNMAPAEIAAMQRLAPRKRTSALTQRNRVLTRSPKRGNPRGIAAPRWRSRALRRGKADHEQRRDDGSPRSRHPEPAPSRRGVPPLPQAGR